MTEGIQVTPNVNMGWKTNNRVFKTIRNLNEWLLNKIREAAPDVAYFQTLDLINYKFRLDQVDDTFTKESFMNGFDFTKIKESRLRRFLDNLRPGRDDLGFGDGVNRVVMTLWLEEDNVPRPETSFHVLFKNFKTLYEVLLTELGYQFYDEKGNPVVYPYSEFEDYKSKISSLFNTPPRVVDYDPEKKYASIFLDLDNGFHFLKSDVYGQKSSDEAQTYLLECLFASYGGEHKVFEFSTDEYSSDHYIPKFTPCNLGGYFSKLFKKNEMDHNEVEIRFYKEPEPETEIKELDTMYETNGNVPTVDGSGNPYTVESDS